VGAQLGASAAKAHQAFAAGDLAGALRLAESVIANDPAHAQMRQLAAVIERRRGRTEVARGHFEAALRSSPRDPHLLNSYANLLLATGEAQAARAGYEAALEIQPGQVETLVNLALACRRLGDPAGARAALSTALTVAPEHPRASQTMGLLLSEEGEYEAAAAALDRALAGAPNDPRALAARAHVETERGGDPGPYYVRARAVAPHDPQLALAEALARLRQGERALAAAQLEALVTADAGFEAAHAALARLRWQDGEPDRLTESYERALQARPLDAALWWGLLAVLMRAGRPEAVLDRLDAAEPAIGAARLGLQAAAATEAGRIAEADAAFAALDPAADPGLQIAYLRHLLRARRPDAAAAFALTVAQRSDGEAAWPYLGTAWRLLGDARAAWLEEDPAFIRTYELPLTTEELTATAELLRRLHGAQAAPFDQTLRGGTQTEGSLLGRREPEIVRLRAALREAIAEHVAGLPAIDPAHPLLRRPRQGFGFAGSWSVRLSGAGFHVNHVHTTGWLSSACYIAVPERLPQDPSPTPGWLSFGAPPEDLGLEVAPFRKIEPRPARLVLFPSTVWHGTDPFPAGERLTVAFDVVPGPG
jgi:Tfp pilus assembly protein PilF